MSDTKLREKADALIAFTQQGPLFIAWVQAVTDALAPAPEKAAKAECPNCGQSVVGGYDHQQPFTNEDCIPASPFTCQPAPPAPAAPIVVEPTDRPMDFNRSPFAPAAPVEMPEAIRNAIRGLRSADRNSPADALESWWRTHAQPVAVGGWQLEELLKYADLAEVSLRTGFSPPDFLGVDLPYLLRSSIAVVRQQAAQGRKVELGKVRAALECAESRLRCLLSDVFTSNFTDRYEDGPACRKTLAVVQQGIAELNAAEGKDEGRG